MCGAVVVSSCDDVRSCLCAGALGCSDTLTSAHAACLYVQKGTCAGFYSCRAMFQLLEKAHFFSLISSPVQACMDLVLQNEHLAAISQHKVQDDATSSCLKLP